MEGQVSDMQAKENKMGVLPVKKLIITMSLPMMVSMLVQALYNVVDSIYVARLSEEALTSVTIAFPLQNLMIAVGSGTGVGINALLSRSLGEKRFDRSDGAANNGLFLTVCNYLAFLLIGLFAAGPFVRTQTQTPILIEYSSVYLRIVCCCSVGLFFQMTFERLLQSTGKTLYSMISQVAGAVINIILDPILIFGLLGCPKMGVAGAAVATVIGQICAAVIGGILNVRKNTEIHLSLRDAAAPKADIIKEIYFVGVPSILMISIGSVMTYLMNLILRIFSETAIAVFGVYFRLQSFFFMPVFGLNNGLIPVLAYNYGARKKKRIDEALRFSIILAMSVMAVGTALFEIFPAQLMQLFNASEEMIVIGVPALRIICTSFVVAGACIIMGSIFQAFSMSFYSLVVSVGRQLVVLIPVAFLLSRLGNIHLVWIAFPVAEIVSFMLSLYFFRKLYRKKVVPLEET